MTSARILFLGIFFIGIMVVISYMDNESQEYFEAVSPLSLDSGEVEASSNDEDVEMSLKNVLITTERINGFDVEVYEEYEVYTNEEGEVVDRVATGHYQTLRYKATNE
ncbi:hypothetical protein LZP85_11170 [Priestia flexa]|jgi:hypothetical protein|uniref:Uncharacterized protein n=2 Tax=Priestia TaxID=2800373 RepID=A0A0V8JNB2_9BACI|nr:MULTISPECIES: hypothetical protein [Bacillaceae]KSU88412.1 hypothetical protein AS180_08250 [Priestia veravalensis]KZB91819.1 hypothetical protein A2U94_08925 [Bacillus sp. VT 712]MBN8251981.1 hypothetical protein [Priestia flexa]MBN8435483.1 hypothetical protein [Priestia flexa]MBY6085522.1 hypothetical protein [Priestia flexa]